MMFVPKHSGRHVLFMDLRWTGTSRPIVSRLLVKRMEKRRKSRVDMANLEEDERRNNARASEGEM